MLEANFIYIYIERERERERDVCTYLLISYFLLLFCLLFAHPDLKDA